MAQITGIEPISMVLETTVLPLNYICISGALDGIRTHTPKALPPEDCVSTHFTTRALKMAGTSGFEPEHAGVKVLCLTDLATSQCEKDLQKWTSLFAI